MASPMFETLLNRRFIIFTGKGGVGKSTIAAATALASARSGKRTLLLQFATHDKAGQLFGVDSIGEDMVEVEPRLFVVKPTPDRSLREYATMILRSKTAYKLVFENKLMRTFLKALPGMNELLLLGKAFNHERERDARGAHCWDRIIIDAPATGHSIYLFQVPFIIKDAVSSGLMHREVNEMVSLIQDPTRTVVHLITLPEEMPVNETLQLRAEFDARMQIPLGAVIVNGVFPMPFDESTRRALEELREVLPEDGDVLNRLVDAACFRAERCTLQRSYLARLREEMGLPLLEVPFYFVPKIDREVLEDIAERMLRASRKASLTADEHL